MSARIKPLTLAAALVLSFASAAAQAQGQSKMKMCADQWNELKAKNQTGGQTYQEFSKKCMSGDGAAATTPAKPATTTTAPATKPAAPKPTQASTSDEEAGTSKGDLARCNASWKDYKAKNNVSGAKAWHVFMASCLP